MCPLNPFPGCFIGFTTSRYQKTFNHLTIPHIWRAPGWRSTFIDSGSRRPHNGLGQQSNLYSYPLSDPQELRFRELMFLQLTLQRQAWDCVSSVILPPLFFSTKVADKISQSPFRVAKKLMMGFWAPTLCPTSCSLSLRFFILLSHVNPVPISTCPHISHISNPVLAAAKQRKNEFRVCFWVPFKCLPQAMRVSVWQVTLCWHWA